MLFTPLSLYFSLKGLLNTADSYFMLRQLFQFRYSEALTAMFCKNNTHILSVLLFKAIKNLV